MQCILITCFKQLYLNNLDKSAYQAVETRFWHNRREM